MENYNSNFYDSSDEDDAANKDLRSKFLVPKNQGHSRIGRHIELYIFK